MLDDLQGGGKREEERGGFQTARACEAEEWRLRAASARVKTATGGRRRRGTAPGEVADVEGHRLARGESSRLSGAGDWVKLQCGGAL